MNPVMYLIVDRSLEMSQGKLASQCAQAAIEALYISDYALIEQWLLGNHHTTIVLGTDNARTAFDYLSERGFDVSLMIDEGRTEFSSDLTPTVVGVEIVDKDDPHVQATFSCFKLYKYPQRPELLVIEGRLTPQQAEDVRAAYNAGGLSAAKAVAQRPQPRRNGLVGRVEKMMKGRWG